MGVGDFGDFADRAKEEIDEQGGMDALKEKGERLKDVASGEGSMADKAREGMDVLRDRGDEEQQMSGSEESGQESFGSGQERQEGQEGQEYGGGEDSGYDTSDEYR